MKCGVGWRWLFFRLASSGRSPASYGPASIPPFRPRLVFALLCPRTLHLYLCLYLFRKLLAWRWRELAVCPTPVWREVWGSAKVPRESRIHSELRLDRFNLIGEAAR